MMRLLLCLPLLGLLLPACCPEARAGGGAEADPPDYGRVLAAVDQQLAAFDRRLADDAGASCPWRAQRALLGPDLTVLKIWLQDPEDRRPAPELLLHRQDETFTGRLQAWRPPGAATGGETPSTRLQVPANLL